MPAWAPQRGRREHLARLRMAGSGSRRVAAVSATAGGPLSMLLGSAGAIRLACCFLLYSYLLTGPVALLHWSCSAAAHGPVTVCVAAPSAHCARSSRHALLPALPLSPDHWVARFISALMGGWLYLQPNGCDGGTLVAGQLGTAEHRSSPPALLLLAVVATARPLPPPALQRTCCLLHGWRILVSCTSTSSPLFSSLPPSAVPP